MIERFHSLFAAAAMPAISTLRVDNSMKNSTMNRWSPRRVHTSTVKKSAATASSQCRLRNSFQVVFRLRSGAGSIPCRSRISAIVLRAISCPVPFEMSNCFYLQRDDSRVQIEPVLWWSAAHS